MRKEEGNGVVTKKGRASVGKIGGSWGSNLFHISNCWHNLSLLSLGIGNWWAQIAEKMKDPDKHYKWKWKNFEWPDAVKY